MIETKSPFIYQAFTAALPVSPPFGVAAIIAHTQQIMFVFLQTPAALSTTKKQIRVKNYSQGRRLPKQMIESKAGMIYASFEVI